MLMTHLHSLVSVLEKSLAAPINILLVLAFSKPHDTFCKLWVRRPVSSLQWKQDANPTPWHQKWQKVSFC